MKRIVWVMFAFILVCSHLGAMKDPSSLMSSGPSHGSERTDCIKECPQLLMQNVTTLIPYINAIKPILNIFQPITKTFGIRFDSTKPLEEWGRTPGHLFLETSVHTYHGVTYEQPRSLHTPFGEFLLLAHVGGLAATIFFMSATFFTRMNWQIEDVTDRVKFYDYSERSKSLCPDSLYKKNLGKQHPRKWYLIKQVNGIALPNTDTDNLIIFSHVLRSPEQKEKDKILSTLFKKID